MGCMVIADLVLSLYHREAPAAMPARSSPNTSSSGSSEDKASKDIQVIISMPDNKHDPKNERIEANYA